MKEIIIAVIIIVLVVFIFNKYQNKYQNFQGNIFNIIVTLLIIVILFSVGYVYATNSVSLKSLNGFLEFGKLYLGWLKGLLANTKDIVGYVINQEWGLNSTATNLTK